jgi:diguanylate cyclase (GGDEF)-like protein/PAS domain S-box-containing protein
MARHYIELPSGATVTTQADEVVQGHEEHFRLLVETSPDGIILTDLGGTIVYANAAAATLCGNQRGEELHGTTMLNRINAEDRAHLRDITEGALHGANIQNAECRLICGTNSFIAEIAISVARNKEEEPTGFVHVIRDITGHKQREEELKDQILHDPLTGLPNRVLVHDRLHQAIENARRMETEVGVLYIDLDHFKEVNDRFGHDYADVLLQQASRRMQQTVRASDTLGRLGGDEFAAVLPYAGEDGAKVTADKLKDEVEVSYLIAGIHITIGASIGIAVYPAHGEDAMTVLRRADLAMYAAKRRGSRNVTWHSEDEDMPEHLGLSVHASDVAAVQVDPRVLSMAKGRRPSSAAG